MPIEKLDYEETYKLMKQLVQNKCINPPGNELPSLETIKSFLDKKGIDSLISKSAPNRGNLFVKIAGDPNEEAILFGPSHVDVVPISNPDNWSVDPFEGIIKDGFMYGRGVLDMLYIVATQVIVFAKVFQEKIRLKGDLMLLIVSDEESGGEFGVDHFFKNSFNLLGDLKKRKVYAITEGGGSVLYNKLLLLRTGERGVAWRKLIFDGNPTHGAFPFMSDNALIKASEAVTRINEYMYSKMPTDTSLITDFLDALSEFEPEVNLMLESNDIKSVLVDLFKKGNKIARTIFSISHLTFSPNVMQAGVKVNTIPGKAELEVDIRTLPNQDENYVMTHLHKALDGLNPTIEQLVSDENITKGSMSPETPEESKFVEAIHKVVAMELPGIKVIPSIVGGGTDARYCRTYGMDAYGFSITNPELKTEDLGPIHGIDEKIDLKSIDLTLNAYYNLVNLFLKI